MRCWKAVECAEKAPLGKSASREAIGSCKLEFDEFGGETGSAWVAQLVERVLGKDEVTGSIPVPGSRISAVRVGGKSLE